MVKKKAPMKQPVIHKMHSAKLTLNFWIFHIAVWHDGRVTFHRGTFKGNTV